MTRPIVFLRAHLGHLAERERVGLGAAWVLALGVLHALFCLLLDAGGHAPSRVLLPIPRERYYLAQAAFVLPLYLGLWLLAGLSAHSLARALGGRGKLRGTLAAMGPAYAAPLIVAFVLPDLLLFALLGFEALGRAMRVYAPLAALLALAACALAVEAGARVEKGRAALAAFGGLLLQALVGGAFLR